MVRESGSSGKFTRWHSDALKAVGGFVPIDVLGEYGMACTFKAQPPGDGLPVTLTVLDPQLCHHERQQTEFVQNAEEAVGLKHPNVLAVLKAGRCEESGLLYVASEFGGRDTLDSFLGQVRMGEEDAWAICQAVAEGLAGLSQRRLSHGALRPATVAFDEAYSTPRISELRVSLPRAPSPDLAHCLAPEQVKAVGDAGAPADLYALGVIFYRCLTGTYPFSGGDHREVAAQRLEKDVPDPRALVSGLSENTARVVSWLCARDPQARYRAAHAVSIDFLRLMAGREPMGPKAPKLKSPNELCDLLLAVAGRGGNQPTPRGQWGKGPAYTFKARVSSRSNFMSEHTFSKELVTVGRSPECELQIDNPIVSRKHIRLRQLGAHFVLETLSKTNTTVVGRTSADGLAWFMPGIPLALSDKFVVRFTWEPGAMTEGLERQAPSEADFQRGDTPTQKFRFVEEETQRVQDLDAQLELGATRAGKLNAVLVFPRKGGEGRAELTRPFQIGRATCCDLRLPQDQPYKAALVVPGPDEERLINLTAEPGLVTLNGEPVHDQAVLEPGDVISVAGVELRFEAVE